MVSFVFGIFQLKCYKLKRNDFDNLGKKVNRIEKRPIQCSCLEFNKFLQPCQKNPFCIISFSIQVFIQNVQWACEYLKFCIL